LATALAERGATTLQLDALFAWRVGSTSRIHARKADRERLAREAISLLSIPAPPETSSHFIENAK
jgi:hypothetical protein